MREHELIDTLVDQHDLSRRHYKSDVRVRHFLEVSEADSASFLENVPPPVSNWMRLLEEGIGWFALADIMVSRIDRFYQEVALVKSKKFHAVSILLPRVLRDCLAVRCLILAGCETQARVLLRPVLEHMDLLASVAHDEGLSTEFLECNDLTTSNQFWNKRIRRGRLRDRVKDIVFRRSELGDVYLRLRTVEDDNHTHFAHPTPLGLLSSMLVDKHLLESSPLSRLPTVASCRTIHLLLFQCLVVIAEVEDLLRNIMTDENMDLYDSGNFDEMRKMRSLLLGGFPRIMACLIVCGDPANDPLFDTTPLEFPLD